MQNPFPLSGRALEEAFRQAIENYRRLIRYDGPIWYVDPAEVGREEPDFYAPFLDDFDYTDYFDVPDDMPEEPLYGNTP